MKPESTLLCWYSPPLIPILSEIRSILILSFHLLLRVTSSSLHSGFAFITLYTFLFFLMLGTCSIHSLLSIKQPFKTVNCHFARETERNWERTYLSYTTAKGTLTVAHRYRSNCTSVRVRSFTVTVELMDGASWLFPLECRAGAYYTAQS
jgi:hypothetical protein